jgi:hypothetical protein
MSLRPTDHNMHAPPFLSAADFARFAIGADKVTGEEGYKNFSIGGWNHWWHYRDLSNSYPTTSPESALDEMSDYRQKLADHIVGLGLEMDRAISRLAKMEEEMKSVIETGKEAA